MQARDQIAAGASMIALAFVPGAHAASGEMPPYDPDPSHYSLKLSGAVEAEVLNRKVDVDDPNLSDAALMEGEPGERLVYTVDAFPYKADNVEGHTVIRAALGAAHASADGEPVGAHVSIHLHDDVAPGGYDINKGFIEVAGGAVPVNVMVRTVSREGEGQHLFSHDVSGRIHLEAVSRESATGRFRFTAAGVRDEEATVEVAGAFNDIPYTPGPVLRVAGGNALAPGTGAAGRQFKKIDARRTGHGIRIETQREFGAESSLVFILDDDVAPGTYQLGDTSEVRATFGGEAASGTVTVTRADATYGAEFDLEVPYDGETGTLSGHFDHARPLTPKSSAEYEL